MALTVKDVAIHLLGDEWESNRWSWPPNVFALTYTVLEMSGAYRLVVAPPDGRVWPEQANWEEFVRMEGLLWAHGATKGQIPARVLELMHRVQSKLATLCVSTLDRDWATCCDLLTLHALADKASEGAGLPPSDPETAVEFLTRANDKLGVTGSLAELPTDRIRVLPKMRTPQVGITIRSLSHHLSVCRSEVDVQWQTYPSFVDTQRDIRLLLCPWPLWVDADDFAECPGKLANLPSAYGFFSYSPRVQFDLSMLKRTLGAASRIGSIDGVVLPEACVLESDIGPIQEALTVYKIPLLLTGVRGPRTNHAYLGLLDQTQNTWGSFRQDKHHRWQIDRGQIESYGLELKAEKLWWEAIDVPRRALTFVTFSSWLTMCHLICEDLSRQEPVTGVVRGVGPNLVVALLQDGPQLKVRWPGQYASVLADDPGSSVLTLTSLGMALRSRKAGAFSECPTIALWADRDQKQEIQLERNAVAVLITVRPKESTEWTADGRSDGQVAGLLSLERCQQISIALPDTRAVAE
jgi:hypothetical protein